MATSYFYKQKKIGRWFEAILRKDLLEMARREGRNIHIIDSDKQSYSKKKGNDFLIRLQTGINKFDVCKCEAKIDLMSQETGNAYIDIDSIQKSDSPIWFFGYPEGELMKVTYKGSSFQCGRYLKVYKCFLQELAPYALRLPRNVRGGEFRQQNPAPPKSLFLGQKFMQYHKTIDIKELAYW